MIFTGFDRITNHISRNPSCSLQSESNWIYYYRYKDYFSFV